MSRSIDVMIVDDHDVVRVGLKALVDRQPDMTCVAEADSVKSAVDGAVEARPDVVILDVRLPDGSGVDACRDILSQLSDTSVIMLTSYADDEALFASIMSGASGYVLKQTRGSELMEAVRRVARGESLLDPSVTQRVLERIRGGDDMSRTGGELLADLSERERTVLELIAEGKTNREIGEELYLSEKTIKHYVTQILTKLDVSNRAAAAALFGRLQGGGGTSGR